MDLGPCTSFLSWDSGNPGHQNSDLPQDLGNPGPRDFDMQRDPENPGPQNVDSRKTLKTQDLKIWICGRAYFNMLTAGVNDPAVIRFAPAVITFCLRDIKDVIRHFACQGSKMKYEQYVRCLYNDSVAIIPPYFWFL